MKKNNVVTIIDLFINNSLTSEISNNSPDIPRCMMKKFIRVFRPFSEYIRASNTQPLPTTISRNSDVTNISWGTFKDTGVSNHIKVLKQQMVYQYLNTIDQTQFWITLNRVADCLSQFIR